MSKSVRLEGTSDDLIKLLFDFMSSMDNPLVYISDLVQNGIDASADHIKIEIIRPDKKRIDKVIVSDNGTGFRQSFENYSKHIGDSLKKKAMEFADQKAKGEVRGEYCIGMQGFRSAASKLEVINISKYIEPLKDSDGNVIKDDDLSLMLKCRRMTFFKGKLDVIIDEDTELDNIRKSHGVTYIISGLTENAQSKFAIQKMAGYLSISKQGYLLKKNFKLEIIDGTTIKRVEPFVYKGEKIIHKITLPDQDKDKRLRGFGDIIAELYYHPPNKGSKIIVTVKGEPIYHDLCQRIEGFNKYPWNSEMVSGTIEYERLSKQPDRIDVQKDSFYDVFIDMIKILEKEVEVKVKIIEKDLRSKEDEKLITKLEDVFGKIRRDIDLDIFGSSSNKKLKGPLARIDVFPDKENVEAFGQKILYIRAYDSEDNELTESDGIEFSWKLTGKLGQISPPQGRETIFGAGSVIGITEVFVTAKDKNSSKELSSKIEIVITHPIRCGSLYRVKIVPGIGTVPINRQRMFKAVAEDANGNIISKYIKYYWKIVYDTSGGAKINKDSEDTMIFTAGKMTGQVKVHLKVQQGKTAKEDFALIDIKEPDKTARGKKKPTGLPILQKTVELESSWHSRLDDKEKILYYNAAHIDYIEIQNDVSRRQRYIANLYAKELTLSECKSLGVEHYGERLLEVMSKLDKYWKL